MEGQHILQVCSFFVLDLLYIGTRRDSVVVKVLALHALESHMVTSSNPGGPASHPAPRLWSGKVVKGSPKLWDSVPAWENQKSLNINTYIYIYIYIYWKDRYTERRSDREEGLPSNDSLPKQLQRPELSQSKVRRQELFLGLPRRCRVPKLWVVLECFPRPKQGAGWEVELAGLEPAPLWDPGAFKVSALAARLKHQALQVF